VSAGFAPLRMRPATPADLAIRIRQAGPIAHQPTDFGKVTHRIYRDDRVMRRQVGKLHSPGGEVGVAGDEKCIRPFARVKRKRKAKKGKPKKRSTRKVDVLTPTVSDEALERSATLPATAACTARLCL
jgi:hypothetical protein